MMMNGSMGMKLTQTRQHGQKMIINKSKIAKRSLKGMAGTRRCSVCRNSNSDNDWRRRGRILRAYEKEDYDDDDDDDNKIEIEAIENLRTATRSMMMNENELIMNTDENTNKNTNMIKANKTRALYTQIDNWSARDSSNEVPVMFREGRIYESSIASKLKYLFLGTVCVGIGIAIMRIYFGLFFDAMSTSSSLLSSSSSSSSVYFYLVGGGVSKTKVFMLFLDAFADAIVYAICIAPTVPALVLAYIGFNENKRLIAMSGFLPYSLAPFAAKDKEEQKNRRRSIDVVANVNRHRDFAKLKLFLRDCAELRFSFALSVLEANRILAFIALALKTLALGFGPSRHASPYLFVLDITLSATAFLSAIVCNALTRDEDKIRKKMEKETKDLEQEYLLAQHKGTFLCRWESDPYEAPGERNLIGVDKAITNSAVGEAAQLSVLELGVSQERCLTLTLDAKDGLTSSELSRRGFRVASTFIPNPFTSVVHALRNDTESSGSKKVNAFSSTIEAFLASRDPTSESFQVIYLDHCGAVMQRTQQIYDVFSRHAINDNGIFAVTFSTRGKRAGWSKDEAVRFAAETIHDAATKHGYVLEGNAAPSLPGLVDYSVSLKTEYDLKLVGTNNNNKSTSGVSNLRGANLEEAAFLLKAMASNLSKQDDVALALSCLRWANLEQTPSQIALETWKSRRRKQMLFDVARKISKAASKLQQSSTTMRVTMSDSSNNDLTASELRKLRSLAREVIEVESKSSALGSFAVGSFQTFKDDKGNDSMITYPKSLYLYGTLMFFVFKVRTAC